MAGMWGAMAILGAGPAHAGCAAGPPPPASMVALGTVTEVQPHGERQLRYRVRLDEVLVGSVASGEIFVSAALPSGACPPTTGYRPGQRVGLAGDLTDGHTLAASFCTFSVVSDPSPAWARTRLSRTQPRDYAGAPPPPARRVPARLPDAPPATHGVARIGTQHVAASLHDAVAVVAIAGFDWARPADQVTLVPVLTSPLPVGSLTVHAGVRVVDGALADGVTGGTVPPAQVGDRWSDGTAAWPSARWAPVEAQDGPWTLRDAPDGEVLLALSPVAGTEFVPFDGGSGWVEVQDPRVHGQAWTADAGGGFQIAGGVGFWSLSGEIAVDWLPGAALSQQGVVVAVAAGAANTRQPKSGRLVACAPDGRSWVWLDLPWGPQVVEVSVGGLDGDPCGPS